jgi:hypothetical protein
VVCVCEAAEVKDADQSTEDANNQRYGVDNAAR